MCNFLRTKARDTLQKAFPLLTLLPIAGGEFFGREAEMNQICEQFHTSDAGQKTLVIWDFGGLGKSRLALRYVQEYRSRYSAIPWINAASFDMAGESFSQAASNIKTRLDPHLHSTGDEKDIEIVRRWLAKNKATPGWLLVIGSLDNVEAIDFRRFIPQCSCGRVLITSALSHVAGDLQCYGLELESIDKAAGANMLVSGLQLADDHHGCMLALSF